MLKLEDVVERCRISHPEKFRLKDHDPSWSGDKGVPKAERKAFAEAILARSVAELAEAQERLYASDAWSVLVVLQAMDAAGKDGTIKHVMSGVNPQGCQVFSFKQPSVEELDHNFLWRYTKALPERGRIGIFNRSYYEEVLVVRVHPELAHAERIPGSRIDESFWSGRFEDINNLERHLDRNGTKVLKFFLDVSKEEQRRRFLKRLDDPTRHWKFSPSDISERGRWDDYMKAYEEAISATSTPWAPWHVVPADHKWVARAIVAHTIAEALDDLNLKYPEVTPEQLAAIEAAKTELCDGRTD
ncbi:polyphosphate kinase 2 family protein [Planctomyces sp. SH-PL62]|uniref:polyphosphate kinase 2 family protein n=1 Tax=Planctomyces sp. SH-PL62 TaxID=1636152 RepID=UPI00078DB43D|nr:polyphosphate kinase 2 family protein [Planctomyces sp. SH-PL62]AMV37919.1 Polyphosphate kinase 2 (PPK2) [Planctomyces sp. SH-PL62]